VQSQSQRRRFDSTSLHGEEVKLDFVLGVDPGLSGALCLLRLSDKQIDIFDMPVTDGRVDPAKLAGIVEMCKLRGSIVAAVENVSSMPRQAGAFNFGRSAGVVHGVLGAMGVPMELVSPNVWKGAVGLRKLVGESQAANKTRARELAQKLWPWNATDFKRVKDDGRAEAALLARQYATSKGY
jgi:crossover junction endodeoxyribonuclease RuvC